jgi:hypothetical protein
VRHYLKAGPKGYCVQCKLDCKSYRGICLLTVAYKVFAKVLVKRSKLQTTDTIFNKQTQLLAYGDDIDNFGRSLEAVHDVYLALEAKAPKVGLKINEQKTKFIIAAVNRTIF